MINFNQTGEIMSPSFTSELENCDIKLGDNAKFSCRITGQPAPTFKWFEHTFYSYEIYISFKNFENTLQRYKNGDLLEESDRYDFSMPDPYTVVLNIRRVEADDRGVYECNASNTAGTVFSKAYLNITGE